MIIQYSENNENRIKWQHRRGGEWKTAELHELIEAYERATEPGDLISREETIKYFFRPYSNEEAYTNVEIEKILLAMPSAEKTDKWIPVSERLPGEDTEVLITDEKGRIRVAEYGAEGWEINDVEECVWQYLHDDPIAWQPLPKPYKER